MDLALLEKAKKYADDPEIAALASQYSSMGSIPDYTPADKFAEEPSLLGIAGAAIEPLDRARRAITAGSMALASARGKLSRPVSFDWSGLYSPDSTMLTDAATGKPADPMDRFRQEYTPTGMEMSPLRRYLAPLAFGVSGALADPLQLLVPAKEYGLLGQRLGLVGKALNEFGDVAREAAPRLSFLDQLPLPLSKVKEGVRRNLRTMPFDQTIPPELRAMGPADEAALGMLRPGEAASKRMGPLDVAVDEPAIGINPERNPELIAPNTTLSTVQAGIKKSLATKAIESTGSASSEAMTAVADTEKAVAAAAAPKMPTLEELQPKIHAMAQRMAPGENGADAAQEAIANIISKKVMENIPAGHPNPTAYTLLAAKRSIRDFLKGTATEAKVAKTTEGMAELASDVPTPDAIVAGAEQSDEVARGLAAVREKFPLLAELADKFDGNITAMAKARGVSQQAMSNRIQGLQRQAQALMPKMSLSTDISQTGKLRLATMPEFSHEGAVKVLDDGAVQLTAKNGAQTILRKASLGAMEGKQVAGSYVGVYKDGKLIGNINLDTLRGGQEAFSHETVHWAKELGLFNESEWSRLGEKFKGLSQGRGVEEDIAVGLSRARFSEKGIVDKIKAFVAHLYEMFAGEKTATGAIERWRTGKMWERPANVKQEFSAITRGETKYSLLQNESLFRVSLEDKGIIDRMKEKFTREGLTQAGDYLASKFIDSMHPVWSMFKRAGVNIAAMTPDLNPKNLVRLLASSADRATEAFMRGMVGADEHLVRTADGKAMNLDWMLEPLNKSSRQALESDLSDMFSYGLSERWAEKKFKAGVDILAGREDEFVTRLRETRAAIDADPERLARVQEGLKRYRDMADETLKYMRDKGRISADEFARIKTENTYYLAMQRVMGESDDVVPYLSKSVAQLTQPLKAIKGSQRQIENPIVSLMQNMRKMMYEADRNEAMRSITDIIKGLSGDELPTRYAQSLAGKEGTLSGVMERVQKGADGAIRVFKDGSEEYWKVTDPMLAKALQGVGKTKKLPIPLTIMGKIMREAVTNFPAFWVRNLMRDTMSEMMITEKGVGLSDLGKLADESTFRLSRGSQQGWTTRGAADYHNLLQAKIRELTGTKGNIVTTFDDLLGGWRGISSKIEELTRRREFKKAYDHAVKSKAEGGLGYTHKQATIEAASQARDLLDFAVAGDITRVINEMIPFTNAAVQGLVRTVRAAKGDPAQFAKRFAIYMLPIEIGVYGLNQASGNIEEWRQQPDYLKDMFWSLKVAPDTWIRIPKPFEIGAACSGLGRALDKANGNQKAFDGYATSAMRAAAPMDPDAVFAGPAKLAVELLTNYDFFRNKRIVPEYEEKLALELRDTSKASGIGKLLQAAIPVHKDARYWDHFLQGQFGGFGRFATDITKKEPAEALRSTAGIFARSPGIAGKNVQAVYALSEEKGLSQSKEMRGFREYTKAVSAAKTPEERDAASARLSQQAATLIPKLQKISYQDILAKRKKK